MALPILDTFSGRQLDRVPFWEVWYGMSGLTRRILGRPAETPEDLCALAEALGWDAISAGGANINSPGGGSSTASDGTDHYVPRGMKALEGLEQRPFPDQSQALARASAVTRAAHAHGIAAVLYLPWCFHTITTTVGLEALALAIYDDRERLHDAFEWVEQRSRRAIKEVAIPSGVDFVLLDGDCAFKTGLMVRPDIFRELVFERTARTVELLKDAGIPYMMHSDGKLDDLIPMLVELGFAAVHGVEAQANDLADIKARFGHEITLIGNMDVVFLTHANESQVREATLTMLRVGSAGGRYVAACNTSPLDYIPQENYFAFARTIRDFRL
jgi:uroporphyrinogen decarboxylase